MATESKERDSRRDICISTLEQVVGNRYARPRRPCCGGKIRQAVGVDNPRLVANPFYTYNGYIPDGRPAVVVAGPQDAPLFLTGNTDWYLSNASMLLPSPPLRLTVSSTTPERGTSPKPTVCGLIATSGFHYTVPALRRDVAYYPKTRNLHGCRLWEPDSGRRINPKTHETTASASLRDSTDME